MIELTLPWPPSVNHYWRSFKGRAILSKEGREYRTRIVLAVKALRLKPFPASARLRVSFVAYPPDRRRRDLDNLLKPLLDGLEHAGLFPDDGAVDRLSIERGSAVWPGGFVETQVET